MPGSLCFDHAGFSLHAQVLVPAGQRERLEHLCRYVARPAIATERLSLARDGRVLYRLRRHWRDGTSAVSFDRNRHGTHAPDAVGGGVEADSLSRAYLDTSASFATIFAST